MKKIYPFILTLFFFNLQLNAQALIDIFNRNLSNQTIILTDWEGYMANPAVRLTVTAPANAQFPLTLTLRANGALLYFDMPSTASAAGPSKTITLTNSQPVSFYLSDFPDRDIISETYNLTITSNQYGTKNFAIKVIDQDLSSSGSKFKVAVDYSQDTTYHFFNSTAKKSIIQTACNDWAYFINNGNFDSVATGVQDVFIWKDNYASGNYAYNSKAYKGYYLFAYGIRVDPNISGGGPSYSNFQTITGNPTGLRRAGAYNADPRGNYNNLGWNTSIQDSTWFLATNLGDVPNDLYSIAHHEIGHALSFNPGYTQFDTYKQQGYIDYPELVSYEKTTVYIDEHDHLVGASGSLISDRTSRKGAFGSEYANTVPYGRWLITKLDLLVLKAIGYTIKNTSAFKKPSITTTALPGTNLNTTYTARVIATGGIPFYKFALAANAMLPPGLSLNSFTGVISGTPTQTGSYIFKIKVIDYDSVSSPLRTLSIIVESGLKNINASSKDENMTGTSKKFILFPNPASAYINLRFPGNAKPVSATISGISGSTYKVLSGDQLLHPVSISSLSSGSYFIEVLFEDQTTQKVFFVKK